MIQLNPLRLVVLKTLETRVLLPRVLLIKMCGGRCVQLHRVKEHKEAKNKFEVTLRRRRWASRAQTQCCEAHQRGLMRMKLPSITPRAMCPGVFGVPYAARRLLKKTLTAMLQRIIGTTDWRCYALTIRNLSRGNHHIW